VVLAVTTYFMYSNYSEASKALEDATAKAKASDDSAGKAIRELGEVRGDMLGYPKIENIDNLKAQVTKDTERWNGSLAELRTLLANAVQQAQNNGASDQEIARLRETAESVIDAIQKEPRGTYASKIDRLVDLLRTQVQLTSAFSADNVTLRHNLEGVNATAQEQVKAADEARTKAEADLLAEQQKHESARQEQVATLDLLQTQNREQGIRINQLENELGRTKESSTKQREQLASVIQSQRRQMALNYEDLEISEGYNIHVTYVDQSRQEVRVNLTRQSGARPLMKFSVFDRRATGLPTDKPKGMIQLISVNDRESIARILPAAMGHEIRQGVPVNLIREGDIVYSPVFNPYDPQKFALVGKLDLNFDGKDDRADIRRMIEAAGGQVVFDLPPPGAGQSQGEISGLIKSYVFENRRTLQSHVVPEPEMTPEYKAFLEEQTKALTQLQDMGIPPLPLSRLLSLLGYDASVVQPGALEAVNPRISSEILNPRGIVTPPPGNANPAP